MILTIPVTVMVKLFSVQKILGSSVNGRVLPIKSKKFSPYTLFSGSSTENFQLNCWKSTFNGNVYTGAGFISNASELYLNGKVDAVKTITTNGWQINIDERNENVEKETMPDWDARIHKMAGAYELTDEDVVRIQDKNVIDGAVKTTGKVEISGTTFDGNCYIIADGDITYNVNDFISAGRVVLYSKKRKYYNQRHKYRYERYNVRS